MANFEQIKGSLSFNQGVAPVLAITLNPMAFEGLSDKPKKREKDEKRIWSTLRPIEKDNGKNNYYVIENFKLVSKDDETDIIIDSKKSILIPYSSIAFLNNQKKKLKDSLVAGVRLIDSDGNVQVVPKQIGIEVEECTTLEQAFIQIDEVQKAMTEYANNRSEKEIINEPVEPVEDLQETTIEPEEEIQEVTEEVEVENSDVDEDEIQYYQDEENSIFYYVDSDGNPLPDETNSVDIVIVDPETFEPIEIEETEETEETEEKVVNYVSDVEELKSEFEKILKANFGTFQLEAINEIMPLPDTTKGIEEVQPFLTATQNIVNQRIKHANNLIESEREKAINELMTKGSKRLVNEVERIKVTTSLDGDTTYRKALDEVEKQYLTEKNSIEDLVEKETQSFKAEYNHNKEAFVQAKIREIEREYDDTHSYLISEKEEDVRTKLHAELENQKTQGQQVIENQAIQERENAMNHVVPRLKTSLEEEIKQKASVFNDFAKSTVELASQENRIEISKLREQTYSIIEKALERSAEIENDVARKVETETQKYRKVMKQNEVLKEKSKILEESNDFKDKELEHLKSMSEAKSVDFNRLHENYDQIAKMNMETVAQHQLMTMNPSFHNATNIGLDKSKLIMLGMGCVTVVLSVFMVANSMKSSNQPVVQTQPVQTEEVFKASETTSKKVGDSIKIEVDGKVEEGKITKVENSLATVQTKDGKEYMVSLNQ